MYLNNDFIEQPLPKNNKKSITTKAKQYDVI